MKKVLLSLGMAVVLALGGVGVANLAAGADHSGTGKQHSPESTEHGQSDDHELSGPDHSKKMRGFAQQHRQGMQRWQACRQAHRTDCTKPEPPGWLKHPDKHPGGWPPAKSDKSDKSEKGVKSEKSDKD